MSKVKGKDTGPEIAVRRALHGMGHRFRLHRRDLPGRPDIILPKYRTVILVHGCFWHRHDGCSRSTMPATRREFWADKFARTIARDTDQAAALEALGWRVIVFWECDIRRPRVLREQLLDLFPEKSDGGAA